MRANNADALAGLAPELESMLAGLKSAREEILPSKFWEDLSRTNLEQLRKYGYENFKRTVSLNYFNWIMTTKNSQMKFLLEHLPAITVAKHLPASVLAGRHRGVSWNGLEDLSWKTSAVYNIYTRLLWEYARKNVAETLEGLEEPLEGNPFRIRVGGKLVSQDLANSALEYDSIMNGSGIDRAAIKTIVELGAGYGRNAYVFMNKMPDTRYVIVDIPPALFVAQKYLSAIFPDRRVFGFRTFVRYAEIAEAYERAQVAFLLPNQLELLPAKSADLFINISSLHEMTRRQITYYFSEIERLAHYFYFKEWKGWTNPADNISVTEADYPVRNEWTRLYWRECRVQTEFFEALFRL